MVLGATVAMATGARGAACAAGTVMAAHETAPVNTLAAWKTRFILLRLPLVTLPCAGTCCGKFKLHHRDHSSDTSAAKGARSINVALLA